MMRMMEEVRAKPTAALIFIVIVIMSQRSLGRDARKIESIYQKLRKGVRPKSQTTQRVWLSYGFSSYDQGPNFIKALATHSRITQAFAVCSVLTFHVSHSRQFSSLLLSSGESSESSEI
jgi:hypothetical protein